MPNAKQDIARSYLSARPRNATIDVLRVSQESASAFDSYPRCKYFESVIISQFSIYLLSVIKKAEMKRTPSFTSAKASVVKDSPC